VFSIKLVTQSIYRSEVQQHEKQSAPQTADRTLLY